MPRPTPAQRLHARVDRSGGPDACHPWTGGVVDGYGRIHVGGTNIGTHRLAWELENGPIPDGMVLDHRCHNETDCPGGPTCPHRRCCNVRHLGPTTRADNARRSHLCNDRRTHCPADHEYTPENTYVSPDGGRSCRTCRRIESRRQNERARRLNIGPYAYRSGR